MQLNLSPIDRDMLVRTVIGESANEPLKGQAAVASVILNRLRSGKHGKDVQEVVFAPHQFEPWSTRRDELLSYSPNSQAYKKAGAVVDAVVSGQTPDLSDGATHFLNADIVRSRRGGTLPEWARGEGRSIGRHTFYAPEGRATQVSDARQVTDPDVLKAFGASTADSEAAPSRGQAVDPQAVTDPAILKAFGTDIAPPIAGGTADAPAVLATPIESGREMGIGGAFVQGFASNEQEALRYLANTLYPNEPIEQAVKRFGQDGGVLYHVGDDGKRYRALPEGATLSGIASEIASGAGKALPVAAGAAVGMLTAPAAMAGPGGLAASLAATGTAAGLGEAARQKIGDMMMGDAATGGVDPLQVASEAGSSLVGQGAGAGIVGMRTRGAVRDIANYDPAIARDAYNDAAKVGIDVTPAEATGLPTLAAQQKRLTNITSTADQMRGFLAKRDQQVRSAWGSFLDAVSPAADAEQVGQLGRSTADAVLQDMRAALSAQARPYYDAFYVRGIPLTDALKGLMQRPVVKRAFDGAKSLAANEGRKFNADNPSARDWDYVKRSLDDILTSKDAMNERTGGRNQYGAVVNSVRRELLGELDRLAPEYATARSIYSTGAEDLTNAMQSALNIVAKTKDTNVVNAARYIFDPRMRSPQMVLTLRRAIEGKNPDAWQAIKRLYISDVTNDALRLAETGDVLNPAGKIHKAFMEPKLQDNLRAAMTDDEWQSMKDLLVVLKRASSVPSLRSDTAFNIFAEQEARRAAGRGWPRLLKNVNPVTALRNAGEWVVDRRLDSQAQRVVELVTSGNPEALKTMKELRKLSPWDRRFTVLFGHFLSQGTSAAIAAALPEPDYQPGGPVGGGAY